MTQAELQDALEALIDRANLNGVLAALADVCYAKAEHVQVDWQDGPLAAEWRRAGRLVERAQTHVSSGI